MNNALSARRPDLIHDDLRDIERGLKMIADAAEHFADLSSRAARCGDAGLSTACDALVNALHATKARASVNGALAIVTQRLGAASRAA